MTALLRRHRAIRGSDNDSGFTLIELLMVLVVLPIVLGGLAAMLIVLLQNTVPSNPHGVATRLSDSQDAQLTSAYFNRDVQGASYVTTSTSPLCTEGAAGGQILGLEWTSGSQTIDVTYFVQSSPPELVRYYCVSTSTPSYPVIATSSSVIADNIFSKLPSISPGSPPNPWAPYLTVSVNCFGGACPGSLNTLPGMPAYPVRGVGIDSVVIQAQESNSSYHYSLTASPRNSNARVQYQPTNKSPSPPLNVDRTISGGNCSISVDGAAAVNQTTDGSITNKPQGTISATGGIYTSDPNPYNPTNATGPTQGSQGSITPPPVYSPPVISQYAGLSDPSTYSGSSYPVITISTPDWDPSTDTRFETGGVLNPVQYPSGAIFVVQDGIQMTKAFSAPQGILLYVTGGNVDLQGNGTLYLNPLQPNFESPTQPLPELVLWMASGDTGTLTLGGNGNTTVINGGIYAPDATTALNGGGANGGLTAAALDTGTLTCVGQDAVAILGSTSSASALTVTPSAATVVVNNPLHANFTVQGTSTPTPTGTVTVYQCGPSASSLGCGQTTGWSPSASDQVGAPITSFTATGTGGASGSSGTFTPSTPGTYCFAAYYTGGNYADSSDTTGDGCFTVIPTPPPVVTITSPTNACTYGTGTCSPWPGSIEGAATDAYGPGLKTIHVSIEDSHGIYYNPSDNQFDSRAPQMLSVAVSGTAASWQIAFEPKWESGNAQYTVTAVAIDSSSTSSTPSTVTFKVHG